VKNIIVCGHYNCTAVHDAMCLPASTRSMVSCFINGIRECRNHHMGELRELGDDPQGQVDL
jgi:carbonic anhydrase